MEHTPSSYEDILNHPHHVSRTRKPMPRQDRAAQFAPFAALTGYGDAVAETARLTTEKPLLTESEKALLDYKLQELLAMPLPAPEITLTYFIPDSKKSGGAVKTELCRIRKGDPVSRELILDDGRRIPLDCVLGID